LLPRASAARTAVEQRGPGHRAPCGVISRQARHTRSSWVSSHASGWVAPVDRCTERRWDTKDCKQLHPFGEAPSRRALRGMGQNHIPEGWVDAVVRGRCRGVLGWVGTLDCPPDEGPSVSLGPTAGGGASRAPSCVSIRTGSRSFSIGAQGVPVGSPLCPPACSRALAPGRLPSVPPGCPEGREPPREVQPALGRPSLIPPPHAG